MIDDGALSESAASLGGWDPIERVGSGFIRSPFAVSSLAGDTFALLAASLGVLQRAIGHRHAPAVDLALADSWYGLHLAALDAALPSPWDPLSASFETADGSWIRTHANAARHRRALVAALGCAEDVDAVAAAIRRRGARELESDIVERGGVAAALRDSAEWWGSAPGVAVASEPLVARRSAPEWDRITNWAPSERRPLAGLRVLDLTRVIAGPSCTQVLAGLGADVLRVDPPQWDEPAVLPLVMWGKRSARLDARSDTGRSRLLHLLSGADLLVHGYRAGSLDRLGLDGRVRRTTRPGLIEVAERAYGWSGPWAGRRGFDSIVQFATGLSSTSARALGSPTPVALPVQALDWTTGYLAAAAAIMGLAERTVLGHGSQWRLSLARTAKALIDIAPVGIATAAAPSGPLPRSVHATSIGRLGLNDSPFRSGEAALRFDGLTTELGVDRPAWL